MARSLARFGLVAAPSDAQQAATSAASSRIAWGASIASATAPGHAAARAGSSFGSFQSAFSAP